MARSKSHRIDVNDIGEPGSGLIQFRASQSFITQLSAIAERLHTPAGVLARQWVAERLASEMTTALDSIENWQSQRLDEIDKKLDQDLETGPVQILHIMPLGRDSNVEVSEVETLSSMFLPLERTGASIGKINRLGYYTEKVFLNRIDANTGRGRATGYVQVFKTGQVESVRILPADQETKTLYGDQLDSDLIRATWLYCSGMHALRVQMPLIISIFFKGVKGYRIKTRSYDGLTTVIDEDYFRAGLIEITEWQSILRPEGVAEVLKPLIDEVWNAAGFDQSRSFQKNGLWRGFQ